jgi:hypothetical protein
MWGYRGIVRGCCRFANPGAARLLLSVVLLGGCTTAGTRGQARGGGESGAGGASDQGGAGGNQGAGGGGASSVDGGSPSGSGGGVAQTDAGGSGPSADGPNCGLSTFALQSLPPDVLIVLDKSASMNEPAKGLLGCLLFQCESKWSDMTMALNSTVMATQATVNWGLKLFPTDDLCGVSADVAAPVAANNAAMVNAAIAATSPSGDTPTRLAITGAGQYLMGLGRPNPPYIVLATDGLPNCAAAGQQNGADDAAAIMAVTDVAAAGIPVFVIGVGTAGGGDATLSAMAKAGGKPRAADPAYYPVTTAADLSAALATIGGQFASCTLPIKQPPDPDNIAVDADGMRVPKSATDGWAYGAGMATIVLNGSWCANYQSGAIKDVQAIFGCPGKIIP